MRDNDLWWVPEARVLDILQRGGWPVDQYERIGEEIKEQTVYAAKEMHQDQLPYEL